MSIMNCRKTSSVLLALTALIAPSLKAATVYTDSVTFFTSSTSVIAWTQAGAAGDGAGILMDVGQSLMLTSNSITLGIGSAWYAVDQGVIIGPDLISSATPFAEAIGSITVVGHQLQLQEGQNFLLGFWLDSGGLLQPPLAERGDSLPGANDRFGWVRLNYSTAGGLKIIDSAISVSDPILAGTLTTVPETSSALIAGLAGGMLLRRRRNA